MESGEEEGTHISEMEVNGALRAMRNRKVAGICGIPPELLKYGGAGMISERTNLFNMIMEEKRVPVEWKKAIIVPIFKNKGSKLNCGNYI